MIYTNTVENANIKARPEYPHARTPKSDEKWMAHKIKGLQLMLKLNYHHFAVGNVPLFNHRSTDSLFTLESMEHANLIRFPAHFAAQKKREREIRFVAQMPQAGGANLYARFVTSITLTGAPLWGTHVLSVDAHESKWPWHKQCDRLQ